LNVNSQGLVHALLSEPIKGDLTMSNVRSERDWPESLVLFTGSRGVMVRRDYLACREVYSDEVLGNL
jgi:hypothetical protein